MKYIIELPEEVKEKFDNATKDDIYGSYYDYNSVIGNAIKNGTPLEFGNITVEMIEESSHCPACIHYVQRDIPSVFCNNCKNRDELYRRIENETDN